MVLCVSPEYLSHHVPLQHPQDLLQHKIISYSCWSLGGEWRFTGVAGVVSIDVCSRIHANNGDTCRVAALAHQGIILQPDFLVYEDLHHGDLAALLPYYHVVELDIYASYPSRKRLPLKAKARKLVDFLADSLREPTWCGSISDHPIT